MNTRKFSAIASRHFQISESIISHGDIPVDSYIPVKTSTSTGINPVRTSSKLRRHLTFPSLLILLLMLVWLPRPSHAGWLWLNQYSFGANTSVIAELGAPSYITGCSSGVNDFILASVNIFVVPRGIPGAGAPLSDVSNASGIPNAIVTSATAGFIDEVLGNTAPAGGIISGDYAVIMDECQNNKYDPGQDFYGEEFSVRIPAVVDPLQTAAFAAQLGAVKASAAAESVRAEHAWEAFDALFQAFMINTIVGAATDPIDFMLFACGNIDPNTLMPYCSVEDAIQGLFDIRNGMRGVMLTNVLHYQGIAADPPDPNYTLLPVLDGGISVDIDPGDPMLAAAFSFGETTSQVESLTQAFLHAMERYQGAEQAGIGEHAFIQARQMEDYARALAEAIPRANAAFQTVAAEAAGAGAGILAVMNDLRATQQRVATTGLTTEERLRLLALGWTPAQIDAEVANYINTDFSSFQSATHISDLAADMIASEASSVAAFTDFANIIVTAQTNLAAQLRLPFPDADAGGPYTVDEGAPIALNGTASSHPDLPNSNLTFSWDLDLDGAFDNASGETPTVTFDRERDSLIGLKVTAPTGYSDVSYAHIIVNDVNGPPQISSASPSAQVVIPSSGNQAFSVTATDPDSNPISYAWYLDGALVSNATSYTYVASVPDAGEHIVSLTLSDGSPNSPDTRQFWGMIVMAPDADSDGYPSNVDCDDSNPDINPGQSEVYYNGLDDDCDPATPDDPDADNDGYDYTVDCDEGNAAINPGATEVCNAIDDNCDGNTDEGFDADSDGITSCGGDCDDGNANVYPGATEVCNLIDDNCNSIIDENFDIDGDGVTSCGGDCDDGDSSNYPGNVEVCDLQDNNCDSSIDEGFDADADGFSQCTLPAADCDDSNSSTYPGAPEICDLLDNNCDGAVDEGVNADNDGDGQTACGGDCDDGDPLNFAGNTEVCDNQDNNCDFSIDEGFDVDSDGISICSLPAADCDDGNASNYPGNIEICDLQDNNCDGTTDENFDLDGDSFSICAVPTPDCDDANPDNYPGNPEVCDLIDNNCDGSIDEGFDADGDGFSLCSNPAPDCDDSNPNAYPGRTETFHNGIDDDCDAATNDDYADTFIIIPDDNGRIYYAQSNGDGSWSNYRQIAQLSGSIRGAAIADYDNDGDLDFTVGSPSGNTLNFHLFTNDGADNFIDVGIIGIGSNTNSYQMDMTAGDFNHDGNMDFLSNSNHQYLHRGMGDGHGNFTVTTIDLGISSGRGMDTADFDHDGHLDYVRATYSSGQVILFRGDGSGGFINSGVVGDPGTDPYGVTAADFNNDGHPDVIANYGSNGNAYFYAGNGDGTFVGGLYVGSVDFNNHGAFDNYDFNRDGNQDLVASTYSSRKIYYYPGNGDGTFGAAVLINPSNTAGNILGISAPPGPPPAGDPVPWVTPNPYIGSKGDTIDLSGEFSTDDGSIVDYSWDFGDGSTDNGMDVMHTFPNIEDEYHVALQVTDNDGRVSIGNGLVTLVGDPPVADAGGPYTFGEDFAVAGIYTVPLDGSGSSDDSIDPLSFEWNLGDSFSEDFASGTIAPAIWAAAGATVTSEEAVVTGAGAWNTRYLVTQRTFPRNSTGNTTFTARIGTPINPYFMWGLKNTSGNFHYNQFPYAMYFHANGWIYIYESGSSRGNKVTYTEGQDYEVRIDAKPGSGATYYYRPVGSSNWITVYDSSHSSEASFKLGITVSTGIIRLDDFARPHTATGETPTAIYDRQDTYNISLTTTDIADQSDTDTTTLGIVAGLPPIAHPGGPYTPGEAQASCGNYAVTFDGSNSSDDSGRIYRYDWDFGDSSIGTGSNPSHTYTAGGPIPNSYTATLTVTDHALQQNTVTTTASINPTPGASPTASSSDYSVDETAANAGLWTVNFNGNSSSDDVGLCDFAWTFGDGGTGTGATPSHQYSAAGDYSGTLTVRDHALQSHQIDFTVHVLVNDPPVADDGGPYAVDEGAAQGGQWTVSFDAGGSTDDNGIWKYEWDFGDGSNGSSVAPTHQYGASGTYDVTLTITDHANQSTQVVTQVTVGANDPPVADAGPDQTTERGFPITLDASGSSDDFGIASYQWDHGLPLWHSAGLTMDGALGIISGTGGWGSRYLFTQDTFERTAGDSYTGRVLVNSGSGNKHMMWGLKNTGGNYSYTQFYYAIYFTNNSIYVYESGSSRGAFGSYSNDVSYDVRIDLKATGATYYYRETGAASWTLLYDSNYSSATPMRLGGTIHSGTFSFSDFASPAGIVAITPPIGNGPVVEVTYPAAGSFNAEVTVTDHASQTDSDSTAITVIEGNPPVANAGGSYLTNEDIPTRFNGRSSTDDFGIKSYTWDFGDGESLISSNPWVDHRYLTEGTYTATLTVTDYAGHTDSDSVTVTVSPEPVAVAVPWAFSGGVEVPHDTISGKLITLKGVAYSLREPLTYEWDFGDGSPTAGGTVSNKRIIQADHTYTGVEGQPFVATLTVTDAEGRQTSDQYLVRIRATSLDIEINMAIDEGLWWLHSNQNLGEFAAGTYGNARIAHGYWDNAGGYGTTGWKASPTASAVQAFEVNAHLELGDVRENPYVDTVARGLRDLPTRMRPVAIGMQTYGDPDTNQNGIGIETIGGDNRPPYEVGQVMDAFVASGGQSTYAITGPSNVRNRNYHDLVVDMVDAYAWGQHDGATVGGGWRYAWGSHPDNSAAQWGAIGMLAAEETWGINIPQWVKDRNNVWMTYSYGGIGFGYTGGGNGRNTTPSGMVQLAFDDMVGVDNPITPEDDRDPRWATAEDYIASQWNNSFWKISATRYSYYAYYAFTKAMRSAHPEPVTHLKATGLDWFKDETNGIARRLVNRQQSNGGWPRDGDPGGTYVGYDLTSAWSVIMLTPTLFTQPPVADAGEDRVWGVGIPLTLDGSRSFHLDPFRSLVKYEWDVDGDGSYDTDSSDPTTAYTYSAANCPGGVLPCNITVRLRVTDNNDPSQTDTDTATIIIAIPPHPPVADANGPYSCTAGIPCSLDGSGSFDIDPTDSITEWQWDLNNDGQFDDASGEQPTTSFPSPGLFNIGLRVLDNAVLNDLDGDGVQDPEERLDDFDFTTVTVLANNPPVADANGPYTVNEGSSIILDGSGSSDPDGNPITYAWDLDNDGQFDDATGSNPTFDASTLDDGTYTIGLKVSDSLLDDTITTTVTVNNVAPSVDAGSDQTVNEGDTVNFSGSFIDPGAVDSHTLEWDFGDGSPPVSGSLTPSHAYVDDGTYTVTLTVTDDDGGVGADTLTVMVNNVPPAVDAGPDQTVNEGNTVNFSGSFTDPGAADSHTIEWDFGDGSPPVSGSLTPSHAYVDDGTYTVTLTVTDDDGGVGADTLTVMVNDLGPTALLTGDTLLEEGQPGSYDASGSTSSPDTIVSYEWDWDYDGNTFQPSGDTGVTQSHTWMDDGSRTVAVRVTDDDDSTDIATLVVNISGVGPTAQLTGDTSLNEGQAGNYDASSSFSSPGTITGYEWDWNYNGSTFNPSGDTGATQSNSWMDNGTYTVAVRVTDDDGITDIAALAVTVNDLGPTAVLTGDTSLNEGQAGSYDASGSTSSPDTIVSYEWDWDYNGSTFNPSGDTGATQSHAWMDNGSYTVAVRVTDDDGSTDIATLGVTINDLGPTAQLTGDTALNAGQVGNYDASGSSSSPDAIAGYEWDWDYDGSTFIPSGDSGAIQSHTWAAGGSYTTAVRVTDDDGSSSIATLLVTVQDVITQPEPPIDDLYARAKDSKLDLVWTPMGGASGYNVYRSTTQGGPYTLIAGNHQCDYCAYADFGLTNGTTYYYVVTWISGGMESAHSNEANATPVALRRRR